ncbi:MAG: hypothetical protein NDJ90_01735 [Oligoflexia bacterium]|nr:hypothetical protein [Oligoflexia bacterium]
MIKEKRKAIRFKPDPGTIAWLDSTTSGEFHHEIPALVREEASKGAGFVVLDAPHLQTGHNCRAQVGKMEPRLVAIRWTRSLEQGVAVIGVEFLD